MSIKIYNACSEYYSRANDLIPVAEDIARKLCLDREYRMPVYLFFVDHDPVTDGDYRGGANFPGRMAIAVQVYLWDEIHMPKEAMINLLAHELRHSFQSIYSVTWPSSQYPKNNLEYQKEHDNLPEEIDADEWAKEYSKFDGVAWWRQMEEMQRKEQKE